MKKREVANNNFIPMLNFYFFGHGTKMLFHDVAFTYQVEF